MGEFAEALEIYDEKSTILKKFVGRESTWRLVRTYPLELQGEHSLRHVEKCFVYKCRVIDCRAKAKVIKRTTDRGGFVKAWVYASIEDHSNHLQRSRPALQEFFSGVQRN